MNAYVFGFISVALATVLSVGGMLFVRKRIGVKTLSSYHEVAGYLLSVVGTLYAVLLGFVVVEAMQHTQDLRVLVDQEASGLCNIYLCSNGLPREKKETIQKLCDQYADAVINDEWPQIKQGAYSTKAFTLAWSLWKEITSYVPVTENEKTIQAQLMSEMCSMTQNHRTRVVSASHGVNPLMWTVLIGGAVFTVLFTYFFGVDDVKAHVIMTYVALTLSLNIFLVFVFGSPFGGELVVQPESFKLDRMIFQNFEKGTPQLLH